MGSVREKTSTPDRAVMWSGLRKMRLSPWAARATGPMTKAFPAPIFPRPNRSPEARIFTGWVRGDAVQTSLGRIQVRIDAPPSGMDEIVTSLSCHKVQRPTRKVRARLGVPLDRGACARAGVRIKRASPESHPAPRRIAVMAASVASGQLTRLQRALRPNRARWAGKRQSQPVVCRPERGKQTIHASRPPRSPGRRFRSSPPPAPRPAMRPPPCQSRPSPPVLHEPPVRRVILDARQAEAPASDKQQQAQVESRARHPRPETRDAFGRGFAGRGNPQLLR